ncbi:uncharacterized protein Z519_07160 [Cladophialophora bantiana CBS 173.52]|uniref:BAH domain-containing protein n=1 Tax=Cladophialophora bantiana (strain ATCC 10958 / CBS 173.52 / CDC B-1940 / NIH 8579) TaxID=1442370 RepID=A0A0D2EQE6_CLAB1|nr:uncharacterized protein Z519_07160 [Cladophialophora bantiana CBS 173.52]KIW92176.1 hypothetical protein Z519_07160 [Cladophialophora bantiana CBS 173.52]
MASSTTDSEEYHSSGSYQETYTRGSDETDDTETPGQMRGRKRRASEMEDDGSENTAPGAERANRYREVQSEAEPEYEYENKSAYEYEDKSAYEYEDKSVYEYEDKSVYEYEDKSVYEYEDKSEDKPEEKSEMPPVDANFTIVGPAPPRHRMATAGDDGDVVLLEDFPLEMADLSIDFSIRPGSAWQSVRRFKNAPFSEPYNDSYTVGEFVYVNRHDPGPPAPPADASEDEKLQCDKDNLWVGLIAEFRGGASKVLVRLFWLYWPHELPMGRQPYHGKRELVLSNHVDIVEAHTISGHAEVSHWDEEDDSNKTVLRERYWRQTLNITASPAKMLSKLRQFCTCNGYDNPKLDTYQCRDCSMWNHEACLIADLEKRAWEKFKKGSLSHEVEVMESEGTWTGNIIETRSCGVKSTSKQKKPWKGKLVGRIYRAQQIDEDEYRHRVH